ncbi:urease accessory protein UreF [Pseudotabrizicola sp. L79]|uniref:urease accessory protein UreF n=1 Tax=Pseudotabrizicola sp. L79 TaxID=3118402 RepID=UPI002F959AEB
MTQGLLTLVQWLSPAFPTGGFAYSHGLESAIAAGEVEGQSALRQWLADVLEFGAGRQDAILLVAALRDDADHAALDDLARALQPGSERLRETLDQGTAFARTVAALTGRNLAARCLPVAVGEAAAPLGLAPEQVVGLYLHSFASNLASVAMRFMPLGQEAGQGALAALHPLISDLAQQATGWTLDDLGTAALGADMAALAHETMDVRIFRT